MSRPRVIIHAAPEDYILAARVARTLAAPGYEWPSDGVTCIAFPQPGQEIWEADSFGCRRNKCGFTIYGPDRTRAAAMGIPSPVRLPKDERA